MNHQNHIFRTLWMLPLLLTLLIMIPGRSVSQETDPREVQKLKQLVVSTQATCVAEDLELDKKASKKLTGSYITLREKSEDTTGISMEAFNAELGTFLSPEQAKQAYFILGSLNKRWDQYLTILVEFDLEEDAMNKASKAVYEYIEEYLVERKKASDANTRFSGRTATSLKDKLDGEIATILSDEQYAAWSQSTARKKKVSNQ
ncbi:hypothetical protein ACFLR8_01830 [Bacteroidota bacterium]